MGTGATSLKVAWASRIKNESILKLKTQSVSGAVGRDWREFTWKRGARTGGTSQNRRAIGKERVTETVEAAPLREDAEVKQVERVLKPAQLDGRMEAGEAIIPWERRGSTWRPN